MEHTDGGTYNGRSYVLTVWWKHYTYITGPYKNWGTAYYKDAACTQLYAKDPYHAKHKTSVVTLNGVSVLAIKAE